jgi:hypothetical protein
MHLESAEYLREGITWLLMALRRAIRQFASREVCDEKRLLKGGVGRVKRLGDPENSERSQKQSRRPSTRLHTRLSPQNLRAPVCLRPCAPA